METPAAEPGGRPVFTEEEVRLIRLWSLSDLSAARQLSAQIAYFATPTVFGVYGLVTGSLVIVWQGQRCEAPYTLPERNKALNYERVSLVCR